MQCMTLASHLPPHCSVFCPWDIYGKNKPCEAPQCRNTQVQVCWWIFVYFLSTFPPCGCLSKTPSPFHINLCLFFCAAVRGGRTLTRSCLQLSGPLLVAVLWLNQLQESQHWEEMCNFPCTLLWKEMSWALYGKGNCFGSLDRTLPFPSLLLLPPWIHLSQNKRKVENEKESLGRVSISACNKNTTGCGFKHQWNISWRKRRRDTGQQKRLRDKDVGSIWYSKMGIRNVVKCNITQAVALILLSGWIFL